MRKNRGMRTAAPKSSHKPAKTAAKPVPPALTASATRLTKSQLEIGTSAESKYPRPWQEDVWNIICSQVGELDFLIQALANNVARAHFYIGEIDPTKPDETPAKVEEPSLNGILTSIGNSPVGRMQIIRKIAYNVCAVGEVWLAAIPKDMLPPAVTSAYVGFEETNYVGTDSLGETNAHSHVRDRDISELEWFALSGDEISIIGNDQVVIKFGPTRDHELTCSPDEIILIRIWQQHPRYSWEPRSRLEPMIPILKQLIGLTMMTSGQVDSRLAGAGLLLAPISAQRALAATMNQNASAPEGGSLASAPSQSNDDSLNPAPEDFEEGNPEGPTKKRTVTVQERAYLEEGSSEIKFQEVLDYADDIDAYANVAIGEGDYSLALTEALIAAMTTPIQDRSSAAAYVPLVLTVPDETVALFRHMVFSSPLDAEARPTREEDLRRLSMSFDAPPGILLGTDNTNHWGAWLLHEDNITSHIEPYLALICDALTTQVLWRIMASQGYGIDEIKRYVVWYDVSHMILRPNRGTDALELHQRGLVSDATARESTGFAQADAPEVQPSPAVSMALSMVQSDPRLLTHPGLPYVVEALTAALSGQPIPPPPPLPAGARPSDLGLTGIGLGGNAPVESAPASDSADSGDSSAVADSGGSSGSDRPADPGFPSTPGASDNPPPRANEIGS